MNKREELIEKGYISIAEGPTINGADYVEAHYFDVNNNYTTSDKANTIRIRECLSNGQLVYESTMRKSSSENNGSELEQTSSKVKGN